jgi:hypothetical protein
MESVFGIEMNGNRADVGGRKRVDPRLPYEVLRFTLGKGKVKS